MLAYCMQKNLTSVQPDFHTRPAIDTFGGK